MYQGSRYEKSIIKFSDIFDGIIGFLFLILCVGMIIFLHKEYNFIGDYATIWLIINIAFEFSYNLFWIVLTITYSGSVERYKRIKRNKYVIDLIMLLIMGSFAIVILVMNFSNSLYVSYLLLSGILISLFRTVNNYFSYVNENW